MPNVKEKENEDREGTGRAGEQCTTAGLAYVSRATLLHCIRYAVDSKACRLDSCIAGASFAHWRGHRILYDCGKDPLTLLQRWRRGWALWMLQHEGFVLSPGRRLLSIACKSIGSYPGSVSIPWLHCRHRQHITLNTGTKPQASRRQVSVVAA